MHPWRKSRAYWIFRSSLADILTLNYVLYVATGGVQLLAWICAWVFGRSVGNWIFIHWCLNQHGSMYACHAVAFNSIWFINHWTHHWAHTILLFYYFRRPTTARSQIQFSTYALYLISCQSILSIQFDLSIEHHSFKHLRLYVIL